MKFLVNPEYSQFITLKSRSTSPTMMNRINAKELIRQGNLTELEELVLQGHGDRLLGESSSAPLVQEFLDNLPNYLVSLLEIFLYITESRNLETQEFKNQRVQKSKNLNIETLT